ncbi:hypothetical protein HYH03_006038 [Edaphochlamys debaryana]|uniref:Uncharacterized protein n=1 Tax=Edaphochlamys debaryana TaxID=47281 RepID=A0A835Y488_9CHLO|nr:hypothetical protein HYH03_006038 [Edaphochlamys debaryana]|eukprot:KAG2495795.1 hypothetical protein HYH03_006038 [Edaphochlamys debaryana]
MEFPRLDSASLTAWLKRAASYVASEANSSLPTHTASDPMKPVAVPLPALTALPYVRRFLLAQLMLAWDEGLNRTLPAEAEEPLGRLIQQLYGIHVASFRARGVAEYFHISKTGGTSWNEAASEHGCAHSPNLGNHIKEFNDECRWLDMETYMRSTGGHRILWARWGMVQRRTVYRTCQERYEHMVARGLSYASNEYTLVGGMRGPEAARPCPQVVNLVTLREPLKRLESAIRFVTVYVKGFWNRRDKERYEEAFERAGWCNTTLDFWSRLAPAISDNYFVRSFLGEKGFHLPVGSLTEDHVSLAQEQLASGFDLVFDLESGTEVNDDLAWQGLGWPVVLSKTHGLKSDVLPRRIGVRFDPQTCRIHPPDWDALRQRQALDVQFYAFGRVVHMLDALWLRLAAALGLQPDVAPHMALALGSGPGPGRLRTKDPSNFTSCGMLWRGSDRSALALALGLERNGTAARRHEEPGRPRWGSGWQGGRGGGQAGRLGGRGRGGQEAGGDREEEVEEQDGEGEGEGEEEVDPHGDTEIV